MQKIGKEGIKVNNLRLSNLFLEIIELCRRGAKFAVDLKSTIIFQVPVQRHRPRGQERTK